MPDNISFAVLQPGQSHQIGAQSTAVLVPSSWDDWFVFQTQFVLVVFDERGARHEIGQLKIGRVGMVGQRQPISAENSGERIPPLPDQFDQLPDDFFSLGQDESYYSHLNALGGTWRDGILVALRDVAFDEELFEQRAQERVMLTSLLRFVTPAAVRGQLRRLARGGPRLSPYRFSYQLHRRGASGTQPPTLDFEVTPEAMPPSNVHVVIGRNGVGKSDLFTHMTKFLLSSSSRDAPDFVSVVSVSFSAFDEFELLPERRDAGASPRLAYVGLRRTSRTGAGIGTPKSPDMMAREFVGSVRLCRTGARSARWRQALGSLEQDPIFHDAGISEWGVDETAEGDSKTASLFKRLSSGHKIVLLTITRLVELVEEKTLILIDEPEAHLHPPLLSAFVRALSDLVVARNGVAIIATHSPVVLQETPRNCVWKLFRVGSECRAERPTIETFGENVGVLTREAFGLEVTKTGFHQLIATEIEGGGDYEEIVGRFGGHLGAEALAILRALLTQPGAES